MRGIVSDDERREMARRLREHKGISRDMKCMLEECLFGPGVLCFDVEGSCASCRDRIIDRLADLIEHDHDHFVESDEKVDRDALLALAEELANVRRWSCYTDSDLLDIADRIREACGVSE